MATTTVMIRGRQYTTVAGRVAEAHASGGYSMLSSTHFAIGDRYFVQVEIAVGEQHFIGTSEVKFSANPGTADGDSPYECAETSALGRALGFAGFGSADSIASANEIARNQAR
jgi:hypothetical protein